LQGHHGDAGAAMADCILPGAAYTEKQVGILLPLISYRSMLIFYGFTVLGVNADLTIFLRMTFNK
jgi:hypothetical protein